MADNIIETLVQKASIKDLEEIIEIKQTIHNLQQKRLSLEEHLRKIDRQIEATMEEIPDIELSAMTHSAVSDSGRTRRSRLETRNLTSLIVEVLTESAGPMKVADIADRLINRKGYTPGGQNFTASLRVLFYKNAKGLFRKEGPGLFGLAPEASES